MSGRESNMSGPRRRLGLAGAAGLLAVLAGCVPVEPVAEAKSARDVLEERAAKSGDGIPRGAIALADGIYAVPVAVDAAGCEQFSEWSTSGVARQIIYFHDGEGGFTATKSATQSCNAVMMKAGVDRQGCAIYRAEQPGGQITDVDYYRSANGYTANPDTAICES